MTPNLFAGSMVMEQSVIAALLSRLGKLSALAIYIVEQFDWLCERSAVPEQLSAL
jgi:hypothetical protein